MVVQEMTERECRELLTRAEMTVLTRFYGGAW